ncbi:MAG: MFS transporter [Caldilineales bacterium]|nr:MFS transporter [Caldilineales bacterium]
MAIESTALASTAIIPRSRRYLGFLVLFIGFVALMDGYLSTIEATAVPYLLADYGIAAADFSWLKTRFMVATFFVFALNALNDIIGRRFAILVLILWMGLGALGILLFTPTLLSFMIFYTLVVYATVSNMWTIPISEEAPAVSRARLVAIVYAVSSIPLNAILPPLLLERLGLDWRWLYGVMFLLMLPLLVMWLFMRETERYEAIRQHERSQRGVLHWLGLDRINRSDIRYIAIGLPILIGILLGVTLYFWAGYYFLNIKGYTLMQWSTILLFSSLLVLAGGLCGGWILDRLGRSLGLIIGCAGMGVLLMGLGLAPDAMLSVVFVLNGFFIALCSVWAFVFLAEIFPTDRRGVCVGWTTSLARVSYILGPALAAMLLTRFPTMRGFWLSAGAMMLIPIVAVLLARPFETKAVELETIAEQR